MHVEREYGDGQAPVNQPVRLDVRQATFDDVKSAFGAGLRDFTRRPMLSLFFGVVYALFGAVLTAGLLLSDQFWLVLAVGVGFPLVAPFLAAGLYDMSRRMAGAEAFSAKDVFLVIFRQQRREFGWMAFVVLFVFWIWAYQVRLIFAVTLSFQGFRSMDHLLQNVLTTADGLTFLFVGTVVGAVLSTVLFSITVIAMPLLLDKNVDFVTAMITSVKSVLASPVVMLCWGAAVGALALLAIAPFFAGVIVIFPILGHASWHLYERLIFEK